MKYIHVQINGNVIKLYNVKSIKNRILYYKVISETGDIALIPIWRIEYMLQGEMSDFEEKLKEEIINSINNNQPDEIEGYF